MDVEIWTSKTFDDQIRLCHTKNLWKGIGEGFGFERGTRREAVLLLRSWEYEPAHHFLPGDPEKYHKKKRCAMIDTVKSNYDDPIYRLYEKAKHHACKLIYFFDRGDRGRAAWQKTQVLASLKQIPLYKLIQHFEDDLADGAMAERELSILFRAMSDLHTQDQVLEYVEDPVVSAAKENKFFKEEFYTITLQGLVAFSPLNRGKPRGRS